MPRQSTIMLFGFELFGVGLSFSAPVLLSSPDHVSVSLLGLELNFRASDPPSPGIVRELLHICDPLIPNVSDCPKADELDANDAIDIANLIPPFLASCVACLITVVAAGLTPDSDGVDQVIPQQMFCFDAMWLPEIEILPPPPDPVQDIALPGLWEAVNEAPPGRDDIRKGQCRYAPPGSSVELFSPVSVVQGRRGSAGKSLFSSGNWY
jgi:hypothetical protein